MFPRLPASLETRKLGPTKAPEKSFSREALTAKVANDDEEKGSSSKPSNRASKGNLSTPRYVAIKRDGEMTRVYEVGPEEDIEAVYGLDRQLSDGSDLGEEHSNTYRGANLKEVWEWIKLEEGHRDTERLDPYPRKPLMGRTRNETAYAVLVEELLVVTERVEDCDVYIHRPCVQVYGEEQPFSISYRRGSTNHQYWHLSHWVVVVDVHLAVQYAALSGVTPLMRYSHYQLCTDLHHRQAISWEYKEPTKVTTAWDRTTQRHLFTHRLYDTVADLRRSDEVEFTESIEGLWRIDAQIHGLVATSANYEGER